VGILLTILVENLFVPSPIATTLHCSRKREMGDEKGDEKGWGGIKACMGVDSTR